VGVHTTSSIQYFSDEIESQNKQTIERLKKCTMNLVCSDLNYIVAVYKQSVKIFAIFPQRIYSATFLNCGLFRIFILFVVLHVLTMTWTRVWRKQMTDADVMASYQLTRPSLILFLIKGHVRAKKKKYGDKLHKLEFNFINNKKIGGEKKQ